MSNKATLKPRVISNGEEARELGRKGGKKSGEVRRAKKTLRQELELLLELVDKKGKTNQEKMSVGLLKKAMKGNVKAFEMIRDTIGQKPKDVLEITETPKIVDDIK